MKIWTILLGMLLPLAAFSQTQDECRLEIENLYRQVDQLNSPDQSGKVFYLHYSVSAIPSDPKHQVTSDEVELWQSESSRYLKGKHFSLIQDEIHSFFILPGKETIFWSDVPEQVNKNENTAEQWHSALLRETEILSCETTPSGQRKVVLELPEKLHQMANLRTWEITYEPGSGRPSKIVIQYREGLALAKQEIYIHDWKFLKDEPLLLSQNAYKQVFSNKDQLKTNYQGYRLIDDRIISTP